MKIALLAVFTAYLVCCSCSDHRNSIADDKLSNQNRVFESSFESVADFDGFYITPQGHLGTTFHELAKSKVHSGIQSHRAWIDGDNLQHSGNNNHRGYPTVQFQHTAQGVFRTPCYVSLWVWLDVELENNERGENDWFSFATFTDDESDNWARTVLVNLSADGFVHLQHTTDQGKQTSIFQTVDLKFPQREWVELKMYLDFRDDGYAKVWQNGALVSYSKIGNISNQLSQAHFGLYCSPQLSTGVVYNDDLMIREVDGE